MPSTAFYFGFPVPPRLAGPPLSPHVPILLPNLGYKSRASCTFGANFKETLPIHQNLSLCPSGELTNYKFKQKVPIKVFL